MQSASLHRTPPSSFPPEAYPRLEHACRSSRASSPFAEEASDLRSFSRSYWLNLVCTVTKMEIFNLLLIPLYVCEYCFAKVENRVPGVFLHCLRSPKVSITTFHIYRHNLQKLIVHEIRIQV